MKQQNTQTNKTHTQTTTKIKVTEKNKQTTKITTQNKR